MSASLQELLVTGSPDGCITAYDASTGFRAAQFKGSRTPRKGLTLIAKRFIAASHVCPETGNGYIHLYNWWSSTPFYKFPMPEPVAPLLPTPDGSYLLAGGVSGQIHSVSIPSGDVILSVAAHSKPITCLEMNDDGSLIFSGSDDGIISVFALHQLLDYSLSCQNPVHLSALQTFIGHESSITAIATGSNCAIVSSSLDCTCKFWSLMKKTPLISITFPCTIWDLKMDPLESLFYGVGSDGFVYSGKLQVTSRNRAKQGIEIVPWSCEKQDKPLTSMATIFRGDYVVTASEDGNICFWDARNGELIKFLDRKQTGSISHLVVLTGLDGHENVRAAAHLGRRIDRNVGGFHRWDLKGKMESFEVMEQKMELEKELAVAVMERKRSIDTLELALGGYEKLLKLILREVRAAGATSTSGVIEDENIKTNQMQ
ncbi:OLC1v1023322C1 [Oldenlandia corymbosa var. corymbosa]|uniref:OLC1v1023322C1 n=1 Tax=Oldenlandia corymbosa var. corymbosa TaxID=529605 RepID=A0AAV1BZR6_OLDCO|nr:OLC1v1023322C1 [Oldenlandia corymbosa var. corymbosa]